MPRCNEAIDKVLVVRPELQLQCFDIAVPLCFGTRTRDGAADEPVLEHPCESEGNGSRAVFRCMIGDRSRNPERFRPPLGLLDPLVTAPCARVASRSSIARLLSPET